MLREDVESCKRASPYAWAHPHELTREGIRAAAPRCQPSSLILLLSPRVFFPPHPPHPSPSPFPCALKAVPSDQLALVNAPSAGITPFPWLPEKQAHSSLSSSPLARSRSPNPLVVASFLPLSLPHARIHARTLSLMSSAGYKRPREYDLDEGLPYDAESDAPSSSQDGSVRRDKPKDWRDAFLDEDRDENRRERDRRSSERERDGGIHRGHGGRGGGGQRSYREEKEDRDRRRNEDRHPSKNIVRDRSRGLSIGAGAEAEDGE